MHLPLLMWKTLSGFGTTSVGKRTHDGIHSCCFLLQNPMVLISFTGSNQ